MTIESHTEHPPAFAQLMQVGAHTLHADVTLEQGGTDSAPSPHDYFDASLAACKTLTAHWYARHYKMPLESVSVRVERDASREREGVYKLTVHMSYQGPLTEAQVARLHDAMTRCPVHKLMTTSEVQIETAPLQQS